jgi:microcin C transport system substrate-binding protein
MRDVLGSEAARIPGSRNLSGVSDPALDALLAQAIVAPSRERLTVLCRSIDRILRAGHYWVPMWNKTGHTVAFWDLFGWPTQPAKYGLNAVSTWWYDEAKARTTALRPR